MPKFTPAPNTGPRFSERAWKRYRPVVQAYMRVYPEELTFTPQGLATETVLSRIRDAIRGQITYRHDPDDVDIEKLKTIYEDTKIIAGSSTITLTSLSQPNEIKIYDSNSPVLHISNPTQLELTACLVLANNSRLNNRKIQLEHVAPEIKTYIIDPELSNEFPNCIIEVIDSTTFTIL